ncbi:MAG: hypothetical protein OHK0024_12080 [Thalassobaculales bacterium]
MAAPRDPTARRAERAHSLYDSLTGLPARPLVEHRLAAACREAAADPASGGSVALYIVDIDKMRLVNEVYGHTRGDLLIQETARRLALAVRRQDVVGRTAGGAFLVVVPAITGAAEAMEIGRRFCAAVCGPLRLGDTELYVSASFGLAVWPQDGQEPADLMRAAEAACEHAKQAGGGQCASYSDSMTDRARRRMRLDTELRRAVRDRAFHLNYQPRIDTRTGKVVCVEALIRWRMRDGTMVPPAEFIPVAEATGMIGIIGEWVLDAACRQLVAWDREGIGLPQVAVNLSALQLRQDDIVQVVRRVLRDCGVAPQRLELELTESMVVEDTAVVVRNLDDLRRLGTHLALDDFGTGYSSLAMLKSLPLTTLKIDRGFVAGCVEDPRDAGITAAVLQLARAFRLTTVAEGVERADQVAVLAAQGCDQLQGYHICRPQMPEAVAAFLLERGAAPAA